jgi:hypothetical protein
MSAIATVLARVLGPLGGPGMGAAIVGGGLALGALGGGLAVGLGSGGGGGGAGRQGGGTLPVYGCPGAGAPLAEVRAGQSVLATGRTQDGGWLRIHLPLPGRTEGWVQAAPLQARASIDTLPVASCTPELAIAAPSLGPTATLTVPGSFPPSAPPSTPPTPTPTPTPAATAGANAKPTLTALTVNTRTISYDTGGYCPTAPTRATFRVKATDDTGVATVDLYWRAPGAGSWAKVAFGQVAGNPRNGTWQVSLDTTTDSIRTDGRLAYYAVATDASGATRRLPTGGTDGLTVAVCRNTGPSITSIASSSGSSLYWDPLGVGTCQTATNITAAVKDSDGVKSVTLFYRKHGAGSWASKRMNNQTVPGKWYANLDTLGDKLPITGPPTDGLDWYIRAVDDLDKASQSSTRSLTIRRCDTEATFSVGALRSSRLSYCPAKGVTSVQQIFDFSISDPDSLRKASVTWRITNSANGKVSSHTKTVDVSSQRFSVAANALDGATFYGLNEVTWTVTTTDRYGGTSQHSYKGEFTVFIC